MSRLELKIPPPVVTLLVGTAMWAAARGLAQWTTPLPARGFVAGALGLVGIVLVAACAWQFRRAGTTVDPMHPQKASALVDTGLYRFSRNPIYLGDALVLVGWAWWLGNVASFAGIVVFVAYLNRFQIEPEERALRAAFGSAFDAYRERVRRWI